MNNSAEISDNFRCIVYSAQVLIPSQFSFEAQTKRRKIDARDSNLTTQFQHFNRRTSLTGLITLQRGNLLLYIMILKRRNSNTDGATTYHLSINTFWSIQTIIQNTWRRLSNPIFAMKAKYCPRSKQECLYQQAHFKRSISNSYDSMYQTLQDEETSSNNSQETLIQ